MCCSALHPPPPESGGQPGSSSWQGGCRYRTRPASPSASQWGSNNRPHSSWSTGSYQWCQCIYQPGMASECRQRSSSPAHRWTGQCASSFHRHRSCRTRWRPARRSQILPGNSERSHRTQPALKTANLPRSSSRHCTAPCNRCSPGQSCRIARQRTACPQAHLTSPRCHNSSRRHTHRCKRRSPGQCYCRRCRMGTRFVGWTWSRRDSSGPWRRRQSRSTR